MPAKAPFDAVQYDRRSQQGPCFVCSMLAGHPDYAHHQIYQDADTVAFLVRWPSLLGRCQQGNTHLHWHIAPLPPGVPYDQQQLRALSTAHGILDVDDTSQAALAQTIRRNL